MDSLRQDFDRLLAKAEPKQPQVYDKYRPAQHRQGQKMAALDNGKQPERLPHNCPDFCRLKPLEER